MIGHMTADEAPAIKAVPDYLHTVTARLVVSDGPAAIEFYVRAFGATQLGGQFLGPKGELIHAEIQIGDSVVMITGDQYHEGAARSPDSIGGVVTALMCLYWEDVDAAWERAVSAGAEVVFPLANQFYGERGGRLRDPWGQQWMMSQHIEDVSPEEMRVRAAAWIDS